MKPYIPRNFKSTNMKKNQQGFTLVELMIAGTLGLVLIGGMIQIFIGSSQTFKVQRAISEVLDKGRTATNFIVGEIENAGFGGDGAAGVNPTLTNNVVFTAGTADATGAGNNDAIRIQYTGTPVFPIVPPAVGLTNCIGVAAINPNYLIVNTFDVVAGELRCNGQPLVDGIESFHVLYGVDTDGDTFADKYMTSANVVGAGNEQNITTVRFEMVVSSGEERVFSQDVTNTYKVLDEADQTFTDKRLRRKFSATVVLVNRP